MEALVSVKHQCMLSLNGKKVRLTTAVTTLPAGFSPQQHLQAVPKHDASGWQNLVKYLCTEKKGEREVNKHNQATKMRLQFLFFSKFALVGAQCLNYTLIDVDHSMGEL